MITAINQSVICRASYTLRRSYYLPTAGERRRGFIRSKAISTQVNISQLSAMRDTRLGDHVSFEL